VQFSVENGVRRFEDYGFFDGPSSDRQLHRLNTVDILAERLNSEWPGWCLINTAVLGYLLGLNSLRIMVMNTRRMLLISRTFDLETKMDGAE
jgi:hypothetical protein